MAWTKERVDELIKLWNCGCSAGYIAKKFRTTRNAIIGKLDRLKKDGVVFTRPETENTGPGKKTLRKAAVKKKAASTPIPTPVPEPITLGETEFFGTDAVHGLKDTRCKWPIGDPDDSNFRFCCASLGSNSRYCDAHAAVSAPPKTDQGSERPRRPRGKDVCEQAFSPW